MEHLTVTNSRTRLAAGVCFLGCMAFAAVPPPAAAVEAQILQPGIGMEHPADNDCVRLSFTAWKGDGSLFSTSGMHGETVVQCVRTAMPGIGPELKRMVAGEKRRIWLPHSNAPSQPAPDPDLETPPASDLTVDVQVFEILKAPPTPAGLKAPPASVVKFDSGVAFQILEHGTGTKHPLPASTVRLHYSGWTTDGKLFESTVMDGQSAVVPLGLAMTGWRAGLERMVVGDKARFWIPALLARQGSEDVVYDIELLGID